MDLPDRADTTARRRGVRRTAAFAAVLVALIGAAAGCGPAAPSTDPSPATTATASPGARADVRNTTLTLPAPPFNDRCGKGGKMTFVNGIAAVGAATWSIGEITPVEGDLDGVPGAELVTTISCSEHSFLQLVALKAGPGGELAVLGYVISPGAELLFDATDVRIEAGVVQVAVTGNAGHVGLRCHRKQVRGYSYRDGLFKQSSGPTDFPEQPLDIREVDLRNSGLTFAVPTSNPGISRLVCASVADGTGAGMFLPGAGEAAVIYTFTVKPHSFATASVREFAIAQVAYRAGGGPEVQSVQAIHRGTDGFEGQILVATGVDGVTGIESVRVDGGNVIVSVTANGAKRTWTYTEKPTGSDLWGRA